MSVAKFNLDITENEDSGVFYGSFDSNWTKNLKICKMQGTILSP